MATRRHGSKSAVRLGAPGSFGLCQKVFKVVQIRWQLQNFNYEVLGHVLSVSFRTIISNRRNWNSIVQSVQNASVHYKYTALYTASPQHAEISNIIIFF
jgi:hypothetical protein